MNKSSRKSIGKRVFDLAVLFIVVVAGVFAGLFVANKTGLAGMFGRSPADPSHVQNETDFKVGEQFPPMIVTDKEGRHESLATVLNGQAAVIGFVSNGCEACLNFVDAMADDPQIESAEFQILLLSDAPEFFQQKYAFAAFEVNSEILDQHKVHGFPTIVLVDRSGVIKLVFPGFMNSMNTEFFRKYL